MPNPKKFDHHSPGFFASFGFFFGYLPVLHSRVRDGRSLALRKDNLTTEPPAPFYGTDQRTHKSGKPDGPEYHAITT
jgi:hypothetical protein